VLFLPALVLTAQLTVGPGCGTGRQPPRAQTAGEGGTVRIIVENMESPGTTMSVHLLSGAGDRELLGGVGARRAETFQVEGLSSKVSYRLIAGPTGGRNIASERFALKPGSTVRWVLPFNRLTVSP
jgi:hypothetical protein